MYHSDYIIRQMQANKILAQTLEKAMVQLGHEVRNQANKFQKGAKRALYYTSCFTEAYQDVCAQQKIEDERFAKGIYCLIRNRNIISELVRIYIELLIENYTPQQLEKLKRLLMRVNIYISTRMLTNQAFAMGVTTAICLGMNAHLPVGHMIGRVAARAVSTIGIYGIVQDAADSAQRLQVMHPIYYHALYMCELEMLYFLVEPVFMRAGALKNQWLSDNDITNIILNLARPL